MLFARSYHNSSVLVETTARQSWRVFWDSVDKSARMINVILNNFLTKLLHYWMTNSNSIIECGQEKAFIICGLCRKPFCFIDFSLLLGKWNLDCALEKLARSPLSVAAEAFVTRRSALLSVRRAQLVVAYCTAIIFCPLISAVATVRDTGRQWHTVIAPALNILHLWNEPNHTHTRTHTHDCCAQ